MMIRRGKLVGGFRSIYPPAHNDTYVKATSKLSTDAWPYYATDPAKSLTGADTANSWAAAYDSVTNQRFHIDMGAPKLISRIYYENYHGSGTVTNIGAKNFTLWGSNSAASFAELTYGTDTGWTQITIASNQFAQHTGSDVADPKYILVSPHPAYRYFAFKIADQWGNAHYLGLRRITLQEMY